MLYDDGFVCLSICLLSIRFNAMNVPVICSQSSFESINTLVYSDLKMLSWPNSPLLVLLQLVDPNVLSLDDVSLEEGEVRETPLYHLVGLVDSSDYSTHVNQLIIAYRTRRQRQCCIDPIRHDAVAPGMPRGHRGQLRHC